MQTLDEETLQLIKYCKFYMAMVINEILKETPVAEICRLFEVKRGDIQSMQQHAINFSGMLSAFTDRLYWSDFSILF